MAAIKRLIVMMEEDEEAALESEARAANVSTAELVRRRLFGRAEPEEDAFLQVLAELRPLVRKARRTLDGNLAEIRALRENAARQDTQVAERARRELTHVELVSVAERLRLAPESPYAKKRRGGRS